MNNSPLRYPGGKAILAGFISDLFALNKLSHIVYVEPYAGGAGSAINLLLSNKVSHIIINDANIGVFSFWNALTQEPDRFIQTIYKIPVTIDEWFNQKAILQSSKKPSFELGVATFFLSRTNHSGVINGGPIGGCSEEKQRLSSYKIDCRFNKLDLIKRLSAIADRKGDISVYNLDAMMFLRSLHGEHMFVYLDPPYFVKGKYLYMNHYSPKDHAILANYLQHVATFKWLLSYDDAPEIRAMYDQCELYKYSLNYSVQSKKIGYEIFAHSIDITFPPHPIIRKKNKIIPIERINNIV